MALALALDRLFGEPPNAVHPVAWMGRLIARLTALAPRFGPRRQLLAGALIALAVPTVTTVAGLALMRVTATHALLALLLGAVLFKTLFALRALGDAARAMRDALPDNATGDATTPPLAFDLSAARRALSSLCSRPAEALQPPALIAATVESLAENLSDSFVAPLFYYALFGLPGALAYRAVNTLDAMIGYHGRYEYLGKASARLDDLLNLIPARFTAGCLLLAGALAGWPAARGWRTLRRDGGRTESPNAGRPMAAMAGLLGVVLEKDGHYRLGDATRPITRPLIDQAWAITRTAAAIAAVASAVLLLLRNALVR
jgi:adenosylcobinamide-phosphate synthase